MTMKFIGLDIAKHVFQVHGAFLTKPIDFTIVRG